jgi:hypothetical protein
MNVIKMGEVQGFEIRNGMCVMLTDNISVPLNDAISTVYFWT